MSDSAVASTVTIDVTAVNDPASGLAITGTAREGQTLTADTTNIVDADGLTSPNYRYQWVRVDGGNETDLGTASTHAVTSADQGKKLKVKVTLTDDDGNTETLEVETGTGVVQRGADVGEPDGDDGRGHVLHVRVGGLCLCGHGRRGCADEREGGDAAGCGESCAGRDAGDGEPGDRDIGSRRTGVHAGGERARCGLCELHVQGERRGVGQRGGQHGDD